MKCLWSLLEGRTRQRLRVRAFSVLFTFLSMGDILDLPQALSHLTVSRNTLHFNKNRRILPSVGALDLTTRDINLSDLSGDRLSSSNLRVPGFKQEEEVNWLHRVPQDKLLHALADSKLSQSREEEEEDGQEEEESIEISRTVEPQVLQRLESKFLKLFGMSKRPQKTVEKKLKVPKYLLDLYQKQNGDETLMPTTNLNLPGRNTRTANTVRTFYVEEPGLTSSSLGGGDDDDDNHLHFNLDSIPDSEQVTGAELRVPFILRKEDLSSSPDDEDQVVSVKILLHDIIKKKTHPLSKKPKQFHLTQPITQPIDSKTVNVSKRRNGTTTTFYLTFDVFPAVTRWGKNRKINHGLLLEIVYIGQNGVPITSPPRKQDAGKVTKRHNVRVKRDLAIASSSSSRDDDDSGKSAAQGTEVGAVAAVIPTQNESKKSSTTQPIVLFTYSDDNRTGRKTRDAKTISRQYRAAQQNQQQRRRKNHRNKNKRRNLCARHNMFVDFTDVGWNDWIVAPPGAHFFHCSGECPFPMAENLNATNHAVIQALVNSMNPGLVPPPCCVPTKYSSLSLLYTDSSDKIVLKNYNEMVVDSCGCS